MSMDSINGPGVPPPTMPPVGPTRSPDADTNASGTAAADGALPFVPSGADQLAQSSADPRTLEAVDSAPAGVDPELWSVLTAEEREFFSVARELGPVTYGRQTAAANETSLPRGRRLDVRV